MSLGLNTRDTGGATFVEALTRAITPAPRFGAVFLKTKGPSLKASFNAERLSLSSSITIMRPPLSISELTRFMDLVSSIVR
ncbi:MAG TPA: hypothetical protein DCR11_09860 [Deltaproteobacteria bacterium]|nr:hypothetical protein [Deltaproteobacteria bacterium]